MKRTNRIGPLSTNATELKYAVMTITTQMEIIRQVEVTPIDERTTRLRSQPSAVTVERSRRTLCLIGCLFITPGILALSVVIVGLTITFRKTNTLKEKDIERYDLGDLHYGISNINAVNFPSNTYLSDINKLFIQKYLSDQLLDEPGYRGLVLDRIFVRNQSPTTKRKQRDVSCWIIFVLENIRIYFDQCSTCTNERNLALHRSLFNRTAFQQPLHLILNNVNVFTHICSIANRSHSIVPVRLNISHIQNINVIHPVISTSLKSKSSLLKPSTQIPTTKSFNARTVVSTKSFERIRGSIATNNLRKTTGKSSSFITSPQTFNYRKTIIQSLTSTSRAISRRSSSAVTKNSFKTTIPSMFEFLPFRPSTISFPRRNTLFKRSIERNYHHSFAMMRINNSGTQRFDLQSQTNATMHNQSCQLPTSDSKQSTKTIS